MFEFIRKFFNSQKNLKPKLNSHTISVPECTGKRYVISDIHGCLITLKKLIKKLELTINDQVFLLGDYIDRGKHSKSVIDYIIELKKTFQVYPLRGNHEEDFLFLVELRRENLIKNYRKKEKHDNLFNSDFSIDAKYVEFLSKLPYFIELDNFLLVHAGFNFIETTPFDDLEEMLWIRNFYYDSDLAKNKTIIHGHNPTSYYKIKKLIKNQQKVIPLDNGCVYSNYDDMGNLLCLELNSFHLITQKNVEDNEN